MRFAVVLSAVVGLTAAVVAIAGLGLLGSNDSCDAFASDLKLAVTQPSKAPDPNDHAALAYGSCSDFSTMAFDAHLLGWDHHTEHTIGGRIDIGAGPPLQLSATGTALEKEAGVTITSLPSLGTDAFLVTRSQPAPAAPDAFDGLPVPANAIPLPVTAYWASGQHDFYAVSASATGATVAQSQQATERLAELVRRRPVKLGSDG